VADFIIATTHPLSEDYVKFVEELPATRRRYALAPALPCPALPLYCPPHVAGIFKPALLCLSPCPCPCPCSCPCPSFSDTNATVDVAVVTSGYQRWTKEVLAMTADFDYLGMEVRDHLCPGPLANTLAAHTPATAEPPSLPSFCLISVRFPVCSSC